MNGAVEILTADGNPVDTAQSVTSATRQNNFPSNILSRPAWLIALAFIVVSISFMMYFREHLMSYIVNETLRPINASRASALEEVLNIPKDFYVAPNASPEGDGSSEKPWDLATALSHPRNVAPGSTFWLRGGIYRGTFTSQLIGTEKEPITVRAVPNERVTIDSAGGRGSTLSVRGAWTNYQGFEVMNSDTRRVSKEAGSRAVSAWRGDGLNVTGAHTKLINLIVHDNADGIGFWTSAEDAEIYGCLIYNNGWLGPDRGHGHAIYAQNQNGTKRIVDNIAFNNFGRGVQAYGTSAAALGFLFEGNISFNNSAPAARGGDRRFPNLFVGTIKSPADRIEIVSNYLYHPPGTYTDFGANLALGFNQINNKSIVVKDNYVAGSKRALNLSLWDAATITGNTFFASVDSPSTSVKNANDDDSDAPVSERLTNVRLPDNVQPAAYTWNKNLYFDNTGRRKGEQPVAFFFNSGPRRNFSQWKATTGFDQASQYTVGKPVGIKIFVRPNKYEAGRANIAVYNWSNAKFADVDVKNALPVNAKYEIRNAQNFFGAPVVTGTYTGGTLRIPLTNTEVATPVGYDFTPASVSPEFNAFVLIAIQLPTATKVKSRIAQ